MTFQCASVISTPMLALAEERVRERGLTQVDLVNADAQSFGFESRFDLIFSRFGIMFFRDPRAAFANLRRALVPGGCLVFVCWRDFERNPWMGVPMAAAARLIPVPQPLSPGEPGPYGLADADGLRGFLRDAGFDAPEIESIDVELPVRGGVGLEEATDFVTSMGPVAGALREAGESQREPVRAAVRRALAPHATDQGIVLAASAWRVRARNPG